MKDEDIAIIEEFERMMRQNAEQNQQVQSKTEQAEAKVWHDVKTVKKTDPESFVKKQEVVFDENKQVIHRDNETLEHDNKSKIYTERPLIDEEPIEHVTLSEEQQHKVKRWKRSRLAEGIIMGEILGRPKGWQ